MTKTVRTRRQRAARGSGDQLRAEILVSTRDLLARTGSAESVSIRAVAEVVGVSPPSIYRHFADKDELIGAVVAELFEQLDDVIVKAGAGAADAAARLEQQGLAYVQFARAHPEEYRLATMEPACAGGAVDVVLGSSAFNHFVASVQECIDEGVFADGDPIQIALEMWAVAHGIASLQIAKPYLPWGDLDESASRVLETACVGRANR
jgi:AcrR family transcriptional regulator